MGRPPGTRAPSPAVKSELARRLLYALFCRFRQRYLRTILRSELSADDALAAALRQY